MKTKKYLLVLILALVTLIGRAQDYLVMPDHQMDSRIVNMDMRNIMELRDGGIVANLQLFDNVQGDYGCMFYKIKYDSACVAITDSVFIEDNDMGYFLLERNPLDNDNVFAKIVCDYNTPHSDFRISFFDDNLDFKPEKETRVPIADTVIIPGSEKYIIDNTGDIIFTYGLQLRKEQHIVKMSLDGTEKSHKVIPLDELPFNRAYRLGIFNESPKEYYFGGLYAPYLGNPGNFGTDTLRLFVLDSLLNIERTIEHNSAPDRYRFHYNGTCIESNTDSTFLVFTKCDTLWCYVIDADTSYCPTINPPEWKYDGVCLSKCGKSDAKNHAAWIEGVTLNNQYYPLGVKKANDGSVYVAFENISSGVSVAKFTSNLGLLWESKCEGGIQYFSNMLALENGGVAVAGMNYDATGELILGFFVVIFKDGCFSLPENKTEERPYTFYPNPANNELNLNISPEVEPSLIELYDIQGRIVRSQQNGFEKVSLRGLPAGTYALRVSLKNGKSYTSTVVKK